jgi:hypothetical protein
VEFVVQGLGGGDDDDDDDAGSGLDLDGLVGAP